MLKILPGNLLAGEILNITWRRRLAGRDPAPGRWSAKPKPHQKRVLLAFLFAFELFEFFPAGVEFFEFALPVFKLAC